MLPSPLFDTRTLTTVGVPTAVWTSLEPPDSAMLKLFHCGLVPLYGRVPSSVVGVAP